MRVKVSVALKAPALARFLSAADAARQAAEENHRPPRGREADE